MRSKLDNKFIHGTWYKGAGLTKREALIKLHKNLDIYLDKKPALKQSDNLLDDIIYQDVLVGDRGFYRLSEEEYNFYISLDKNKGKKMTYYKSHLVAASQTKQISLPFNGLYHSYLGDELDIELEQCTHEMTDSDATAVYDFIYSLDLKKYHQALAKGYALFVIDSLNDGNGLSIEVSDIDYVPMNMQNRGDELLACVNVNTLPIIPLADLQPYATDSLTSHSGFSSFYDPNLQHLSGARLENWQDVYITFIIEYLVNEYLASDISDIEYSFIDELRCNGGAIELLLSNISDEQASELNNLLYEDK